MDGRLDAQRSSHNLDPSEFHAPTLFEDGGIAYFSENVLRWEMVQDDLECARVEVAHIFLGGDQGCVHLIPQDDVFDPEGFTL